MNNFPLILQYTRYVQKVIELFFYCQLQIISPYLFQSTILPYSYTFPSGEKHSASFKMPCNALDKFAFVSNGVKTACFQHCFQFME